jgi:prepilin-type N-terminal cleavage/methylation domain-containing protein
LGGFTLLEMSITLLVVGVLLASIMLPLQSQVSQRKVDEARLALEQAREALLNYASEFGYFPCPADAVSGGQEPKGTEHATGACPSYHGFFPAALVGYTPVDSQGYAIDSWGSTANRIRYAVSSQTIRGVTAPFTRAGGMSTAGAASVGAETNLFHICGSGSGVNPDVNCGTAQTLASNAAIVVWSIGANGAGAGGASVHEAQNPNANGGSADRIFVSRPPTTGAGTDFDDVVLWIPSLTVVNRLVSAGKLP